MTPKEKAEELIHRCKIQIYNEVPQLQSDIFNLCILKAAKQCAIIVVDEVLLREKDILMRRDGSWGKFEWQEVKQEILTYGGNK